MGIEKISKSLGIKNAGIRTGVSPPKLNPRITLPEFHKKVQKSSSVEDVLRILNSRGVPYYKNLGESLFVMKTLMDKAKWFNLEKKDIDSAIKIWTAVHNLIPSAKLMVIKTMMDVANKLADYSLPKEKRDIDSAIKIWIAVYNLASPGEKLRVISTITDIASKFRTFCTKAIAFFEREKDSFTDQYFYFTTLARLYYSSEEYSKAIEVIDSSGRKELCILAQKADTLRKLGKYKDAISFSSQIIQEYQAKNTPDLDGIHGFIQASICRGYCYYEQGRNSKRLALFKKATRDFINAIGTAKKCNLPIPPRACTGLGYVYESLGNKSEAMRYFKMAQKIDPDNIKAAEKLM